RPWLSRRVAFGNMREMPTAAFAPVLRYEVQSRMKHLAILIASLLIGASAAAQSLPIPMPWVKLSEFYYSPLQVRLWRNNPVWLGVQMCCGSDYGPQDQGQWTTVDLSPWLGANDAKMALLVCELVITG